MPYIYYCDLNILQKYTILVVPIFWADKKKNDGNYSFQNKNITINS